MTWIIFFILTVILIGIELLVSWKRPLLLQGIRVASHILSVIAAFFITKACSAPLAKMSFVSSTAADDLAITQLSEFTSNISPIVSALVSPIAFLIIWALTGIAFYIIYKIIAVVLTKNMNLKERNVSSGEHAASMAIGGVMAILISLVIWMPLSGYVVTADNMVNALYADAENRTYELPENVNLNLEKIEKLCEELNVPYHIVKTDIGKIIFEDRKETNPCALCAKMRKGALNEAMKTLGCNKIAYAHHMDDVVETMMMSLIFEGRFHTFAPVTYLDRMQLTVIRPLMYMSEADVIGFINKYNVPVVKSPCPADGHTKREYIKQLLQTLNKENPGVKNRMFTAIKSSSLKGYESS